MFTVLTPPQRAALIRCLAMAATDTLTEVTSAVKLGRAQFDALYGDGAAQGYVDIAHEQAMLLADLALGS